MSKRAVDILVSLVGLLVLLPLLLLIALLIKLDSPGPVFFRQLRVGLSGKSFRIFKFRTMVDGAYQMGSRLTVKRDPRVTRVGQTLRWFKIDELPQLINVLIGDMSLIGPRPEDPHFVRFYTREQRDVLSVRPGMVGPSQILGRDELESYPEGLKDTEAYYVAHILPDKLNRDLEYVATASFRGDMALLARGLWATARGAIKTKFLWRRRHRVALFAIDSALVLVSGYLALLVRYDFVPPADRRFFLPLLLILGVRSGTLMYYGAYQGVFAYFGLWDLMALFKAITVSALIAGGLTFFIGLQSFPRSVFVIDWAMILFLLAGVRYLLRAWVRHRGREKRQRRQKALVVGAGVGGEQIARTLLEDPLCPYRPVGFIDEMPERWGSLIHGVRVLGGATELPLAVSANKIDAVFCLHVGSKRQRGPRGRRGVRKCSGRVSDRAGLERPAERKRFRRGRTGGTHAACRSSSLLAGVERGRVEVEKGSGMRDMVLLTGGAGFVGAHLTRQLLARGRKVRVLDSFVYGDGGLRDVVGHPDLDLVNGDICDAATLSKAVQGARSVIALAAVVGDAACDLHPERSLATNYESTKQTLSACEEAGVKRLVFASSCSVYGANGSGLLDEKSHLNPVSLYARTRVMSEKLLQEEAHKTEVVILRLATVCGVSPRMRFDLMVNTMTACALANGRIRVTGAQQWRPHLHVQDAAEAFALAAESPDVNGGVFNVGTDEQNFTIGQVAEKVAARVPGTDIEYVPNGSDARSYRVSFDHIREQLGFRGRRTVDDAIGEVAELLSSGAIDDFANRRFHNAKWLSSNGSGQASK